MLVGRDETKISINKKRQWLSVSSQIYYIILRLFSDSDFVCQLRIEMEFGVLDGKTINVCSYLIMMIEYYFRSTKWVEKQHVC